MTTLTRRQFLMTTAAAGALGAGAFCPSRAAEPKFKTTLKTALIRGLPDEKSLAELKEAGYDGMECSVWDTTRTRPRPPASSPRSAA